ncbi:MAG: iron ABC transporter permease [Marinifilaceae bacterium]
MKQAPLKFTLLAILVLIFFVLDLVFGSVTIPFKDFFKLLLGDEIKESWRYIILDFRLPKAITAILAGASLSVAGLLMQTLFRNPLAGPFVLGVSSGASLGVALYIMGGSFFISTIGLASISNVGIILSAVIGALAAMFLVIIAGAKLKNNLTLLIVGIMFGSLTSAVVSILQYFSTAENIQRFVVWTMGSLSAVSMSEIAYIAPLIIITLIVCVTLQKPLNTILLGENYAKSLGTNIDKIRMTLLVITGILAGVITAYTGPIAFIGIAIPHLSRNLFKTSNHSILIPSVILIGSIFMLICDIFSQLPGNSSTLPINSVSAIFGAPIVIWIIMKRN